MPTIPVYGNFAGYIVTLDPVTVMESPSTGTRRSTLLTLYNPNASAMGFILRLIQPDPRHPLPSSQRSYGELIIERFDSSVPATDSWTLGLLGGKLILKAPAQRYEVVLDSTPTKPIKYCVDYEDHF